MNVVTIGQKLANQRGPLPTSPIVRLRRCVYRATVNGKTDARRYYIKVFLPTGMPSSLGWVNKDRIAVAILSDNDVKYIGIRRPSSGIDAGVALGTLKINAKNRSGTVFFNPAVFGEHAAYINDTVPNTSSLDVAPESCVRWNDYFCIPIG